VIALKIERFSTRWCKGDDIEDCTHKQRYEASYQSMVKGLQQNTWIHDKKILKSCKIKRRSDVGCRLCKRAREKCGASTENLPEETYGHINSVFCDGMATTVTAAHHLSHLIKIVV